MEHVSEPVLSHEAFALRLLANFIVAATMIVASLLVGVVGYHAFCGMGWIDAFLNAAMILSGMGPTSPIETIGGKIFAGLYALYSGLVLVLTAGLILAPIFHRVLHRLHVWCDGD